MNRLHQWYCRSGYWKRKTQNEILPWTLDGLELGDAVLEIGPGPGMTTDWLRHRVKSIECLEVDPALVRFLSHRLLNTNVHVRHGDATAMPYNDYLFSGVVSFTMLHHIPSFALQDRLFAEVYRVLRPGGIFAGVDSLPSSLMNIIHIGDTMVLVDPDSLVLRLKSVGFTTVETEIGFGRFRFSAKRPLEAKSEKACSSRSV